MVARFALRASGTRYTRRGLRGVKWPLFPLLRESDMVSIAVLTSELAATIDVDGTDRAKGP